MKKYWFLRLERDLSTEKRSAAVLFGMAAPQPPEEFSYLDTSRNVMIHGFWYEDEKKAESVVSVIGAA
jgi:hypothetical protein